MEKEATRIDKKGKEITKTISYRLQFIESAIITHYQILLIILLSEFTKLNVHTDMIIKNITHVKLNTRLQVLS